MFMSIEMWSATSSDVRVMVRVRPFLAEEIENAIEVQRCLDPCISVSGRQLSVWGPRGVDADFISRKPKEAFTFHQVFWSVPTEQHLTMTPYADQSHVYGVAGKPAVRDVLDGYNTCIMTYGQTGSGKTYTVFGTEEEPGIAPRLLSEFFLAVEASTAANPILGIEVHLAFYEIYCEKVTDLCTPSEEVEAVHPKIRKHPLRGVYLDSVRRYLVDSAENAMQLVSKGRNRRRKVDSTADHFRSKFHAVLQMDVRQIRPHLDEVVHSSIYLLDSAGSDKLKLRDGGPSRPHGINQSLTTLRKVIDILVENKDVKSFKHQRLPPVRESVLTYCMSDCLGGNCRTQMIATVSPHENNFEDSISNLRYANRSQGIVCRPGNNTQRLTVVMDTLRAEISSMSQKLNENSSLRESVQREIATLLEECEQLEREFERGASTLVPDTTSVNGEPSTAGTDMISG